MGLILKGEHNKSHKPVAIKLIDPDSRASHQATQRFKEELRLMRRVEHANVVRFVSDGRAGEFDYLVMEWIEGDTLRDKIQQGRSQEQLIRFQSAAHWFRQVCKGLAAIHAVGVIHRDIKPSNILIDEDGDARVSDLGIAKRIESESEALTTTGQAPGTWVYMAPEQHNAPDTVDPRADLYALGATFYELLTCQQPIGGWSPASSVNETVPSSFDHVLTRLIAFRPSDRFADIHEVLAAFSEPQESAKTFGSKAGKADEQQESKAGSADSLPRSEVDATTAQTKSSGDQAKHAPKSTTRSSYRMTTCDGKSLAELRQDDISPKSRKPESNSAGDTEDCDGSWIGTVFVVCILIWWFGWLSLFLSVLFWVFFSLILAVGVGSLLFLLILLTGALDPYLTKNQELAGIGYCTTGSLVCGVVLYFLLFGLP